MSDATALHAWDRGIGWEVHREHGGGCDGRGAINDGWHDTFREKDAARIALTWNAHDSLVEALSDARDILASPPSAYDQRTHDAVLAKARAALEEAKP